MGRLARSSVAAALALTISFAAQSHAISTNYLLVEERGADINATWDVAATDLHWALDLDGNHDGRVVWGEIAARRADIAHLALSHLTLRRGAMDCAATLTDLMLTRHAGEPHVSLQLRARCPRGGGLEISSTLFFDTDASQKTLLDATTPAGHFNSLLRLLRRKMERPSAHIVARDTYRVRRAGHLARVDRV